MKLNGKENGKSKENKKSNQVKKDKIRLFLLNTQNHFFSLFFVFMFLFLSESGNVRLLSIASGTGAQLFLPTAGYPAQKRDHQ